MRKLFLLFALLLTLSVSAQPKREFRGAWIQCVNGQFQGMGTQKMQQTLYFPAKTDLQVQKGLLHLVPTPTKLARYLPLQTQ